MAFKLISGPGDDFQFEATVASGTAIQQGDALDKIGASNVLQRATATSTIHTIFAIAGESISATATKIKCIPIIGSMQQIWEVATTNNTATTQRYQNAILTDTATLNNTGSDVTGPTGIFTMLDFAGVVADKKATGFFNKLGATST